MSSCIKRYERGSEPRAKKTHSLSVIVKHCCGVEPDNIRSVWNNDVPCNFSNSSNYEEIIDAKTYLGTEIETKNQLLIVQIRAGPLAIPLAIIIAVVRGYCDTMP